MELFEKLSQQPQLLLITTSHVGNNIFCIPAIHLLKKHLPHVEFDLLAMSHRGADVFEGNPDIRKIYRSNRKGKIRKIAKRYAVVISFYLDKTEELLQHLPQVISNQKLPAGIHRADAQLEFISKLIHQPISETDRHYIFHPQTKERMQIKQLLQPAGNKILIGLHLGNGSTAVHGWKFWYRKKKAAKSSRLWSIEEYIALAQQLQQLPNVQIVITGSKNEGFLGKEFCHAVPSTLNLIGKTSLLELVALMSCLTLFITQDTGALHAACASETHLIGLFGPTDPYTTGPYPLKPQHTLIKKESMKEITPHEVFDAVNKQLALLQSASASAQ